MIRKLARLTARLSSLSCLWSLLALLAGAASVQHWFQMLEDLEDVERHTLVSTARTKNRAYGWRSPMNPRAAEGGAVLRSVRADRIGRRLEKHSGIARIDHIRVCKSCLGLPGPPQRT